MDLKERIALARKQAGLSQEQLGEKLGVSRQAVSKWESGQSNPDVAYIIEMCRLFGVSSDWLLMGEEGAYEVPPIQCPNCRAIVTPLDTFCPSCGRNLRKSEEPTYTLVFKDESSSMGYNIKDLQALSRTGWFDQSSPLHFPLEQTDALSIAKEESPILARGLSGRQVINILQKVEYENHFFIFYDSDGDNIETLSTRTPLPHSQFVSPKEPLSFGGMVGAVVVGIIITIIILSFL